jgi:hypothetical protein
MHVDLKPLNVNLDELIEAMGTRLDGTVEWFLDTETGAIHVVDEEDLDEDDDDATAVDHESLPAWQRDAKDLAAQIMASPERFVAVPQTESHEAYRVMEQFIAQVPDPRLRERLEDAIAGKGAFRRFKDVVLDHPRVREDWFRFESKVKRQRAAEWLASLGIKSTWQPPPVAGP